MSACWQCETCGQTWCGIDFCIYCDQKVAKILPSQREQVAETLKAMEKNGTDMSKVEFKTYGKYKEVD